MTKDLESKKRNNTKESKIKANTKKEKKELTKKIESEYDEDLETEVEIEEISKPKKNKKEKTEPVPKEIKKKKQPNPKLTELLQLLDKNRHMIYGFIAGVLLTTLIAFLIWPDRIATLKDGTQPIVTVNKKAYTADELYEDMKEQYSVNILLDKIDNDILTKKYKEDETMTENVKSTAQNYINSYKQYYGNGYTEEQFLTSNGFDNYNEFLEFLKLEYRRNKYLEDYIKQNITDKEIEDYYNKNVYGDINTQHILVEVSSNEKDTDKKLSDADAKKLAEEIIGKINDGTKWDDIKKEYKDKITFEDLGYQSWDASLEQSFINALKGMKDNSFSEEPVKTSYGYHVIYRLDQKKKPTLKNAKSKIIDTLLSEKKSADTNLLYKSLISLRKEKNIKFSDTVMQSKYEEYCNKYK